jgi:hypothetical protein
MLKTVDRANNVGFVVGFKNNRIQIVGLQMPDNFESTYGSDLNLSSLENFNPNNIEIVDSLTSLEEIYTFLKSRTIPYWMGEQGFINELSNLPLEEKVTESDIESITINGRISYVYNSSKWEIQSSTGLYNRYFVTNKITKLCSKGYLMEAFTNTLMKE